jgi:hypothetical protein
VLLSRDDVVTPARQYVTDVLVINRWEHSDDGAIWENRNGSVPVLTLRLVLPYRDRRSSLLHRIEQPQLYFSALRAPDSSDQNRCTTTSDADRRSADTDRILNFCSRIKRSCLGAQVTLHIRS